MGLVKRLLGAILLVLAISIPSCQAVFPHDAADGQRPAGDASLPR